MILRFLRLFHQFRALEVSLSVERDRAMRFDRDATQAQAAGVRTEQELSFWKQRSADLEAEVRKLQDDRVNLAQEKAEAIANAGDAIALRALGRRMFSKVTDADPQPPQQPPINLSSGSRPLARDIVARKNREYFLNALKGTEPKPSTN